MSDLRAQIIEWLDAELATCEAATLGPWDVWDGPDYVGGGRDLCIGAGEKWLFNMDHRTCQAWEHHIFHCEPNAQVDIAQTSANCDLCLSDENMRKGPPFPECTHTDKITAEQRANANLIARARTSLPLALRALRAETLEHKGWPDAPTNCEECGVPLPCPALRRIARNLGIEGGRG